MKIKEMKMISVPQIGKITPKEVLDEIKKFEYINKSPYSSSYYNMPGITWHYKPEGSLRISDHWNFISHNEKHCILAHTNEKINNYWMLAKYMEGKYYVLKEFGENVDGYRFFSISENDTKMLKYLYDIGGTVLSKEWYKKFNTRSYFIKEAHLKNKKILSKSINKERLEQFLVNNKEGKRIVFIDDMDLILVKTILNLYEKSKDLEILSETKDGLNYIKNQLKGYEFIEYNRESFEEVYTVILNNNIAIDFKKEYIQTN